MYSISNEIFEVDTPVVDIYSEEVELLLDSRALAIIRPLQPGEITVMVSAKGTDTRSVRVYAAAPGQTGVR